MAVYFQFPVGWWVIILFLQRKSYQRIEIIAINLKVWTYFPGNWPVILWIGYFGSGLLGYQLVKKVEEMIR